MRIDRNLRLSLIFLAISPQVVWSQTWITSVSPPAYSVSAPRNTNILISFSRAIALQTLSGATVTLWAEQSGRHSATLSYDQENRRLTIDPTADFFTGEDVDVVLTRGILSTEGDSLPGYAFSFTIGSTGGSGSFDPRSESGIGPSAVKMLTHDFNRDGVVDIELLDDYWTNNRIFFVRHPGTGPWVMTETAYLAWPPVSMAAGDLDNDSQSDFAVTKANDALTIVKRNQWGYYDAGPLIPVGFSATQVRIADVNADGWQDLIVGRKTANNVLVLLNSGDGSFGSPPVNLGPSSPGSMITADIDLDGDMDLLIAQPQTGSVKIYLNDGRGAFVDSLQVPAGIHPIALAAGDLDGDGLPDLVAVDSVSASITVVQNQGPFELSATGTFAVGGDGPTAVLLADFDGDGDLDIATMNHVGKSISIFKNLSFLKFSRLAVVPLEYTPNDFSAVDWDFDGDLDIFAISQSTNYFSILTNRAGIPRISLPASSVDFGGAIVDSMATRKVWVYNVGGSADLQVHVQHSANPQFVISPDSFRVAPDDSASFTVGFTPILCSSYADSFTLTHNDPLSGPLQISIRGYGNAVRHTDPASVRAWQSTPIPISMTFAEPMGAATVSDATISIFGTRSGRHHTKNLAVSGDRKTATFEIEKLITEETVTITLTAGVRTARGTTIVAPYSWSFKMRASQGTAVFGNLRTAAELESPNEILAGDLTNSGRVDLVVRSGSNLWICMATDTGWVHIGGPGSTGGSSLGDVNGQGGVGIVSGNWTDASYLWWDHDSTGGATGQNGELLGSLPDFPHGSTTCDFDGDGDLDVLYCFMWLHSARLFRNSGTPPFQGVTFSLDGGPMALAAADFNGDGLQDIVASTNGRDAVAFCRNLGDGTFEVVARPFVGQGPLPLAVADFNNDGRPDVAVGAYAANVVSVLLNQGNFQFQRVSLSVPGKTRSLAAADFNADGKIDLAAAIEDAGSVLAWTNDGSGNFSKILDRHLGTSVYGVEAVDYLKDGRASLVVTVDSYLALLENKKPEPEIEATPSYMTFPNVKLGATRTKNISIRNAGGRGTLQVTDMRVSSSAFSLSPTTLELPVGASQQVSVQFSPGTPHAHVDSVRIASNDPDTPVLHIPVFGTGYPVTSTIPVQNGKISRSGDSIRIEFPEEIDAGSITAGSIILSSPWRIFDRNAIPSMASVTGKSMILKGLPPFHPGENVGVTITPGIRLGSPSSPSSPFSWLFRAASAGGTGAFEEGSSLTGPQMPSPTFLDIDHDGDLDIAYSGFFQNVVFIYRNDGTGTYSFSQRISPVVDCGSITVADFDRDGDLDIAVSQQAFTNAVTILRNDGTGQFTPDAPMYLPFTPGLIIAADYDNDGDADIMMATGYIYVLENSGDGNFTLRVASPPGALGLQAVGDFDNDGFLDVCTTDMYSRTLALFSYEGLGMYQKRYEAKPGQGVEPAVAGDFDGDGLCDIAFGGTDAGMQDVIMVLKNDGNWGFSLLSTVPITSYTYGLGAGDLDGDGDLDLVSANTIDAKVTVALNDGTGHFTTNQILTTAAWPMSVKTGDIDNDGDLDLMVEADAGVVHLFKNGFILSAPEQAGIVPKVFSLDQNFPNPFNPSTTIRYGLPCRSVVHLTVFNTIGQQVTVVEEGEKEAGFHELRFDGTHLASGVYFYRLQAHPLHPGAGEGDFVQTRKLLFLR